MAKVIGIIIGVVAIFGFAMAWSISGPVDPPEIIEHSELTCSIGVPVTYYGFDANYTIGYCGKSKSNSEWIDGPHNEVTCHDPMVIAIDGKTMTCVDKREQK